MSSTDNSPRGVLFSMCLAVGLVVASVSALNLALPSIAVDLGATDTDLTWIADAYTVALAALVLPLGAFGDRVGRRRVLLAGTVLFGPASLALARRVPERAADAAKQSAAAGIDVATRLGDQGTPLAATVRHAFMAGFSNAMWVVTAVAVLFAVIMFVRAPELSEDSTTAEAAS